MPDNLPIVAPGKRLIVSGMTGSGKSTLVCWLLNRSRQHWIIFNPKWTDAYTNLPDSNTLKGFDDKKFMASVKKYKYTIINFTADESTPQFMDDVLDFIHHSFENVGVCLDELYTVHSNGQAGRGLISLLTRGRELKQTFIGATQRPKWISRFCYSEADYVSTMQLNLREDLKTLRDNTGSDYFLEKLGERRWFWYNVAKDDMKKYGPVPLVKKVARP